MVFYSYAQSVEQFTAADKNRIVAIFLNMEDAIISEKINWESARLAYGSASIESMKKSLANTLKKVVVDNADATAIPAPVPDGTTPKKTPASKGKAKGTKRKTEDGDAAGEDGTNETGEAENIPTPKKAKKGGRAAVKKDGQGNGSDGDADAEAVATPKKARTPRGKGASATKAKSAKLVKEEAEQSDVDDAVLDESIASNKDDMA